MQHTAGTEAGNPPVDAYGEHVPGTGRVSGGRDIPVTGAIDEQARGGGAADKGGFPASVTASVYK